MGVYTGIGSRETPLEIQAEMKVIGSFFAKNGHFVRSGHAKGADYAFEQGAGVSCLVYLPWTGFNSELPLLGSSYVVHPRIDLDALVYKFHPNYSKLTKGAFALHRRNGCQILGKKLDRPSTAVVCWTPGGTRGGGTGQALRIAQHYNIPILDMAYPENNTALKVLRNLRLV